MFAKFITKKKLNYEDIGNHMRMIKQEDERIAYKLKVMQASMHIRKIVQYYFVQKLEKDGGTQLQWVRKELNYAQLEKDMEEIRKLTPCPCSYCDFKTDYCHTMEDGHNNGDSMYAFFPSLDFDQFCEIQIKKIYDDSCECVNRIYACPLCNKTWTNYTLHCDEHKPGKKGISYRTTLGPYYIQHQGD